MYALLSGLTSNDMCAEQGAILLKRLCLCLPDIHAFNIHHSKVHEFQVEPWIPLSVEHFESTFLAYCARYSILET